MSTNESARDKTRSVSIDNERITEDIGWDRISQEIPLHPSIYLHRSSKRQARNIVPANCRSSSIHERINSINKLLLTDRKSIKSGMKSVVYLTRRLPIDVCLARSVPPTTRNESVAKQGGGRRRGEIGGGGIGFRCRDCKCDYTLHPPVISVVHLSALAGRLGFQLIDPNPVAGLIFSERHARSAVLACEADVRAHPINTLRPRWNTFFSVDNPRPLIFRLHSGERSSSRFFRPFIRATSVVKKGSIKSGTRNLSIPVIFILGKENFGCEILLLSPLKINI